MISRREMGRVSAVAVLAALSSPIQAAVSSSTRQEAMLSLVQAFYLAHNKGHWGTLDSLLTEDARGRSNSGYVEWDASCDRSSQACGGSEHIGGKMEDKASLLRFLQDRKTKNDWIWDFSTKPQDYIIKDDGYVCTFIEPYELNSKCSGVMCSFSQHFLHVFWVKIEEQEGAILSCKIGDFTEAEMMKVGDRYM